MDSNEFFSIFLLGCSLLMSLMIGFWSWRYRNRSAVKAFQFLLIPLIWWLLSSLLENTSSNPDTNIFWMKMGYLGIATLPVMWLLFTLHYTERAAWWRRRGIWLLFILPVITNIMVWTDGIHHLMWQDIQVDSSVLPLIKTATYNTWFWVHAIYCYIVLIIGTFFLFRLYFKTSGIFRKQLGVILVAAFIPWIVNIIYVAKIGPTFTVDPTPIAFVVTCAAFLWGLSQAKLLNIMPVAHEAIFQSMSDGVLVIDERNRIQEVNQATTQILQMSRSELFGKKISQILPKQAYALEKFPDGNRGETFITIGENSSKRYYKIHVSPIFSEKRASGRLVLLHDDTERRKAENEAREKAFLKDELDQRKIQEKALADYNVRLQALSEESPAAICNVDLLGNITYVNKRFEESSQYKREEILGKNGFKPGMFSEDIILLLKERMKAKLEGKPSRHVELPFTRKDGTRIWVSIMAEPIRENNIPVGIQILAQDITEHRKMEEAQANEAMWRRILIEQSRDGIVILDQNGKVIEANRRFCEILGYSQEEIRQLSVFDWEVSTSRDYVIEVLRTVDEKGRHFETKNQRKDGTIINVEISINGATFAGQKHIFHVYRDITKRKLMEKELRESEEFSTSLLENAPNPILVVNPDTSIKYINQTLEKLTGFTADQYIGTKAPYPWWPEESIAEIGAALKETIDQCGTKGGDYIFQKKDGERFWVVLNAAPVMNKGILKYLLINWVDITTAKKNESALRKSEEKYRMIFESANDVIILTDRKSRIVDVNEKITEIGGYRREELIGKSFQTLTKMMSKRSIAVIAKNYALRLLGIKVPTYEVEMYRHDGQLMNVEINAVAVKEDNKIIGTLATLRDVTARRKAEAAVEYQRELIDQIIATTPNAVLVINEETNVLLANGTFCKTFHLKKKRIENKPVGETIHVGELEQALKKIVKTKQKNLSFEFRYSVNNIPRLFATGVVKMQSNRYLVLMSDITEEREKQERLYLTDRLASVGEMASGVAHELNNPLTSVIGLSSLLMQQAMPQEVHEDLVAINSEAQRCAAIVKNLLTFARKHAPKREKIQVVKVIDDVLKLRAYELRGQNITVETNFAPDLPEVLADYFQIQQVFLNIILNAETAMVEKNGQGLLKISSETANKYVKISFSDNGPGISPENIGLIFNPFFTTKEVGKGTGLGLSICYGIIASHGGKIYAKSQPGNGATFVVELPVFDK